MSEEPPAISAQPRAAPPARGPRLDWYDVPADVRAAICSPLGADVVSAHTVHVGFSPGVAARLCLDNGRDVFLKAVSPDQNPDSPTFHRAEARITAGLPRAPWAPRLLSSYDDGHWVALILEHIDGRQPGAPWTEGDLTLVVDALAAMHAECTPAPLSVPPLHEGQLLLFRGWRTLLEEQPPGLDAWSAQRLPALAAVEGEWPDACTGDTLLHGDLRADNVLIADERVVLLDWPWACMGAGWVDAVFLAPSVEMQGGARCAEVFSRYPVQPDRRQLAAMVAAVAGFFTERSLRPAPPGLPSLRAFQAAQGEAARGWLDRLMQDPG
jgi:hypothetical protein